MSRPTFDSVLVAEDYSNAKTDNVEKMLKVLTVNKSVIFACIGTDRATGDSYGPFVGTLLSELGYHVIGTLKEPLHAMNLPIVSPVLDILPHDLIIAVDAIVGLYPESVGKLKLATKPVEPGEAMNKELPKVGDIALTGVVTHGRPEKVFNCRFDTVYDLAKLTVKAITNSIPPPNSPLYNYHYVPKISSIYNKPEKVSYLNKIIKCLAPRFNKINT